MPERAEWVRKAVGMVDSETGYSIEEATKVSPQEYAKRVGGFKKVQRTLPRMVKKHKYNKRRANFSACWRLWLGGASTDEAPSASEWDTATLTTQPSPTRTLLDALASAPAYLR